MQDLRALAKKQYGHFSRADALRLGVSDKMLATGVVRGQWVRAFRNEYVLPDAGPLGRIRAALTYAGSGAVVSHNSALLLLGFATAQQDVLHVTIPSTRRVTPQPGLKIHVSALSAGVQVITRSGMACTSLERSLLDTARDGSWSDAEALLCSAVQQGRTTAQRLGKAMSDVRLRNARLLGLIGLIAAGAQSGGETEFVRLCRRGRLPSPQLQVAYVGTDGMTRHADAGWPLHGVYVEIDGRLGHFDVVGWGKDKLRDNEVAIAQEGIVLRYTLRQLRDQPHIVLRQLRSCLFPILKTYAR